MLVFPGIHTPDAIHQALLSAWNTRDFAAFRSLLHPGVALMFANAFPDGQLELLSVCTGGNRAVCEFIATGTHHGDLMDVPASGRPLNIRVANILIYREHESIDMVTMMTQLGAMP